MPPSPWTHSRLQRSSLTHSKLQNLTSTTEQFTTIREAILNHFGEALPNQQAFSSLHADQQGAIIEFLKTLTTHFGD